MCTSPKFRNAPERFVSCFIVILWDYCQLFISKLLIKCSFLELDQYLDSFLSLWGKFIFPDYPSKKFCNIEPRQKQPMFDDFSITCQKPSGKNILDIFFHNHLSFSLMPTQPIFSSIFLVPLETLFRKKLFLTFKRFICGFFSFCAPPIARLIFLQAFFILTLVMQF